MIAITTVQVSIALGLWVFVLSPGIVLALKRQWTFLWAGLAFGGIVWFVAAFRLARPNSFWARRFYGPDKLARAEARYG